MLASRIPLLAALVLGCCAFGAREAAAQCSPSLVGNLPLPSGGTATDVAVSGSTAYVAVTGGTDELLVVDVSDPANPALLGSLAGTNGKSVEVFGNHAFLCTGINLRVIDVSVPAVPAQVGIVDVRGPEPASTAEEVALSADGMTAYTICSAHPTNGYFAVVDISTPASPAVLGTLITSNFVGDVAVDGTTAYAFKGFSGQTFEIDVSTPASPSLISSATNFPAPGGNSDLAIHDGLAYSANINGLYEYSAPGTNLLSFNGGALTFSGDRGYALGTSLTVIDMSTPATPAVLGSTAASGSDLAYSGGYVYVADLANGLDIYDATSCGASLTLSVADCQDDADASAGYQIEVELDMALAGGSASGFAAFVDYDMGTFAYRGDLSSYSGSPFALHISPIVQGDDGLLELDGSVGFSDPDATADALLATLVFDVMGGAACNPAAAMNFETGGAFISKLSLDGVAIETVLIDPAAFTLDDTPPMLTPCPANIVQASDADSAGGCGGAIVTFTDPTATDNCDPSPVVVCSPASGSLFPVGITTVTCTATDVCGNESSCTFDVEVTATNEIDVTVELAGVNLPVSRCIHFQTTDSCMVTTDQSLAFVDHDGDDANNNGIDDATEGTTNDPSTSVRATDTITVACGVYTGLCAKDEQHTKWADSAAALTAPGANYVAAGVISLKGGDTDNNGQVEIDDVTWFLFQFGATPAAAGGCPWDGTTRDADFSNNDAVGAEDYSFLTSNWLTTSSCACSLPDVRDPHDPPRARKRAISPVELAVDFSRDGWIDARDVEIFETRHGLPHELSQLMYGQ